MHWAVALLILATAGCSSRAAMQRMHDQLDYLEASQRRMERDMMRLDSLTTVSSSESRRTRAEVSTTLEDLQRDTQAMRESVDELRRSIERRPARVVYRDVEPTVTGTETDSSVSAEGPDIDPSQLYENAFLDVRKGNYELAIDQFRDVLEYFGDTDYAPNARYWIGECWYSLAGTSGADGADAYYDSAIVEFEILISNHTESDRVPTALYKLGRCYEELNRPRRACAFYGRLIEDHPRALEVPPAESRRDALDCR